MVISLTFFLVKKINWNWVNNRVVTVDKKKEVNKFVQFNWLNNNFRITIVVVFNLETVTTKMKEKINLKHVGCERSYF